MGERRQLSATPVFSTWCPSGWTGDAFGIDRTRPFHLLRWLAFALFVVGFLLDLLAS
ncbi:hypothetical protein [Microbispora sp. CA-102843]|uniref:hypothetical protein n=1 Tax=Microbispora sp. CA-102843 TaxID=3239952 RepID=UPI003D8E8A06